MRYRGYEILHRPKPIPTRDKDWDYVHNDFDGAAQEYRGPGNDSRAGSAASVTECKAEIDAIEGIWYSCQYLDGEEKTAPCEACMDEEACRDRTDDEA